jgi:hypothetical protein
MQHKSLKCVHYQPGVMLGRICFEFPGEIFSPEKDVYQCPPHFRFEIPSDMQLARIHFGSKSYLAEFKEHLSPPHEDQSYLCSLTISGRPKDNTTLVRQLANMNAFCGAATKTLKVDLEHDELIVAAKVGTSCFNTTDIAFLIYTKVEQKLVSQPV